MASLISKVICESESLGSSAQRFRKAQLADATWSLPTWWLLWNPYKYEYVCDLEVLNPIPSIKCCLGTLDFIQSLSSWMSGIRDFVGLLRHKLQGGPAQTICVCSILPCIDAMNFSTLWFQLHMLIHFFLFPFLACEWKTKAPVFDWPAMRGALPLFGRS